MEEERRRKELEAIFLYFIEIETSVGASIHPLS